MVPGIVNESPAETPLRVYIVALSGKKSTLLAIELALWIEMPIVYQTRIAGLMRA